ncbi:hypothetical protein MPLDJ20_20093 [Mesorhizobium plurifarium]|uniref:Uncharacterized protein n=1 Tax=Mesorhizobium plurifarium TaxID=69974 RepID=A0A090F0X6_MESPL|nr:hypothetical protein MPLDJ20_20093 [Mesorhizobium plurifarium]
MERNGTQNTFECRTLIYGLRVISGTDRTAVPTARRNRSATTRRPAGLIPPIPMARTSQGNTGAATSTSN